jgi:hypothetical protein
MTACMTLRGERALRSLRLWPAPSPPGRADEDVRPPCASSSESTSFPPLI